MYITQDEKWKVVMDASVRRRGERNSVKRNNGTAYCTKGGGSTRSARSSIYGYVE